MNKKKMIAFVVIYISGMIINIQPMIKTKSILVFFASLFLLFTCKNDNNPKPGDDQQGASNSEDIKISDTSSSLASLNKDGMIRVSRTFINNSMTSPSVFFVDFDAKFKAKNTTNLVSAGTLRLNGDTIPFTNDTTYAKDFNTQTDSGLTNDLSHFNDRMQLEIAGSNSFPALSLDLIKDYPGMFEVTSEKDTLRPGKSFNFTISNDYANADSVIIQLVHNLEDLVWEQRYGTPVSSFTIPGEAISDTLTDNIGIIVVAGNAKTLSIKEKDLAVIQFTAVMNGDFYLSESG